MRGAEFDCTANRLAVGGRLVDLRTPGGAYGEVLVPLHGAHQGDNAACAAGRGRGLLRGAARTRTWSRRASPRVRRARAASRWSAGSPLVRSSTGPTTWPGWRRWPTPWPRSSRSTARRWPWSGMLRGRDPSAMLAPLARAGVRSVVACAPASPRALPAEEVAEAAPRPRPVGVRSAGSVAEAVARGPGPGDRRRPPGRRRVALRRGRRPGAAGRGRAPEPERRRRPGRLGGRAAC